MKKQIGKTKPSFSITEISRNIIAFALIFFGFYEMSMPESVYYFYNSQYAIVMWRGIACICFSLLLFTGFDVKKKINWIGIITYLVFALIILIIFPLRNCPGDLKSGIISTWDLWRGLLYKCMAIGATIPLITDAIVKKEIRIPNVLGWVYVGFLLCFCCFSIVFDYDKTNNPYFIFIILVFAFIKFDKKKLGQWAVILLVAIYFETIYISIKGALSPRSYGVIKEYYYGIYKSAPRFGEFVGYGALSILTLFILKIYNKTRIIPTSVFAIIAMIPLVYMMLKINVRNPFLALGIAMMIGLYVVFKKYNITRYYLIIILAFCLIPMLLLLIGFVILKNQSTFGIFDNNLVFHRVLLRLGSFANRLVTGEVSEHNFGVLKKGTLIYLIDVMLSRRISLAILTIINTGLLGKNEPFSLCRVPDTYPHNALLKYLYNYGLLAGSFMVGSLLLTLFNSIKNIVKCIKSKNMEIAVLLAFFWQIYCFFIFMNEADELFRTPVFIWLLLGSITFSYYSFDKQGEKQDL